MRKCCKARPMLRNSPGSRHEQICSRLHRCVQASVANLTSTQLLPARFAVSMARDTIVRPDLALITVSTKKLWLAAEIVNSEDHAPDTVTKKQIYEEMRLPRLWMIDPRYDNVEVYHASPIRTGAEIHFSWERGALGKTSARVPDRHFRAVQNRRTVSWPSQYHLVLTLLITHIFRSVT